MKSNLPARSRFWVRSGSLLLLLGFVSAQSAISQDQGVETAPTRIETESYDILFSTEGLSPIQWHLLLPMGKDNLDDGKRLALIDRAMVEASSRPSLRVFSEWARLNDVEQEFADVAVTSSSEGGAEIVRAEGVLVDRNLKVSQTYRIPRSGYVSKLSLSLSNVGDAPQEFSDGLGIPIGPGVGPLSETLDCRVVVDTLSGGTLNVEELEFDASDVIGPVHWVGLQSRYYLLAVIPETSDIQGEATAFLDSGLAESNSIDNEQLSASPSVALTIGPVTIPPGESVWFDFLVYAGPKVRRLLRDANVGLEKSIYCHLWRWLATLCVLLESILAWFYSVLGNWGVSIVVLALVLRFCMFPISRYGIIQQQDFQRKQAQVKPLLAEIKQEHKGDLLKINEETLKVYKEYGITTLAPLKSCLPLMIQLPILFALYQILNVSYELKDVPFLWIDDLSVPDRLFSLGFSIPLLGDALNLLPLMMFACHVAIARDMAARSDKKTKKPGLSSYSLSLVMLVLFYSFPAGCMLYWTVGSISQVFEQRAIRKRI